MPTLGEELKRRREERGITLNDISESTRIGTRFLKAIETDNFSILPGGIFTRSFIRAYAREVGMNEDEAVALYQQQITGQPAQATQPAQPVTETRRAPKPAPPSVEPRPRRPEPVMIRQSGPRVSWPTIIIAGGIALFIVIVVVALVKQLNKGSETEQSAPPVAQKAAPQPANNEPVQNTAPSQPTIGADQPLSVKLEAVNGDSWLRYEVDGVKGPNLLLKQGQPLEIPAAKEQVKLHLGNRQALSMKINNREASFPPNTPKTVADVLISRDNLQTYFQ
ncbi:MAG TPA: RodZ domain-containing protein [Blastocatellia bacterium]|nr:RodZ domain-containing protein [Blastocatellia bacterium]